MGYKYWRLYITGGSWGTPVGITELAFRLVPGGTRIYGGTASASSQQSPSYAPAYAFDWNTGTQWTSASTDFPHWIRYDYSEEKTFAEYTLYNTTINYWQLQASNDGINWDVLDDQHYNFSPSQLKSFPISYPTPPIDIEPDVVLVSSFQPPHGTNILSMERVFSEQFEPQLVGCNIVARPDTVTVQSGLLELPYIPLVVVGACGNEPGTLARVSPGLVLVSASPLIPWWGWVADPSLTQIVYIFTLTGSRDGQEDITIPISSAQSRLRDGEPTYLSVVIPSSEYFEAVTLRPNGEMILQRGVMMPGGAMQLEEIARVTLEDIRIDEGPRNQSVSLSGHATMSNSTPKTVELTGASYRNLTNGSLRYRCALNNFLRPGDTAIINGETLLVNSITYTIGVSSEAMEIAE